MKLNYKRIIFVGIAFLIIQLFWNVYDQIIPKILVNTFGLNQTWSGAIMALDNVLALFLLPIFGAVSDKCKSKHGKRTPFIIVGTIAAAVLFAGLALIDQAMLNADELALGKEMLANTTLAAYGNDVAAFEAAWIERQAAIALVRQNNVMLLVAFMGILLLVLIAMAVFRSPAVALMPDVTPKPLRSGANAIINLMGVVGGVIGLGAIAILSKDFQNYTLLFIAISVLMLIALVIFLLKVNEPKLVDIMHKESEAAGIVEEEEVEEEKSNSSIKSMDPKVRRSFILILASVLLWYMAYNAASTKYSLYAQNVLGIEASSIAMLVAQAVTAIGFIPLAKLSENWGRKKTIIFGIIIFAIGFIIGCFVGPNSSWLIYIVMSIVGLGWAAINVNSYPMVVEMAKESDTGKFTGYYYTASMFAQVVTPILSGWIMDATNTMRVLFPYCVVMAIGAFVTMIFVKHGDAKPITKKSKLEHFSDFDN